MFHRTMQALGVFVALAVLLWSATARADHRHAARHCRPIGYVPPPWHPLPMAGLPGSTSLLAASSGGGLHVSFSHSTWSSGSWWGGGRSFCRGRRCGGCGWCGGPVWCAPPAWIAPPLFVSYEVFYGVAPWGGRPLGWDAPVGWWAGGWDARGWDAADPFAAVPVAAGRIAAVPAAAAQPAVPRDLGAPAGAARAAVPDVRADQRAPLVLGPGRAGEAAQEVAIARAAPIDNRALQPPAAAQPVAYDPATNPPAANRRAARFLELGDALFQAGAYREALERYRFAARAVPRHAPTGARIAQVHVALGRYDQAIEVWRQHGDLAADLAGARFRWGELYPPLAATHGEHAEALAAAVEANPADADLMLLLAMQLYFGDAPQRSAPFLRRAEALDVAHGTIVARLLAALEDRPLDEAEFDETALADDAARLTTTPSAQVRGARF